MNETSTLSGNLDRIKNSTDQIRAVTNTNEAAIEDVAVAVANLSADNEAKTAEIAALNETITEITPTGTLNIDSNGTVDVSAYETANVNVVVKEVEENDVNFIDYDGKFLYSYTKDEFLALSAFPDLVPREGMTPQEWNYDFTQAQNYVRKYGKLDIGQTCITDDESTRIYIELVGKSLSPTLNLGMVGTATVEWGDGTSEVFTGEGYNPVLKEHTYPAAGKYMIRIMPNEGTSNRFRLGGGSEYKFLFADASRDYTSQTYQWHCVKKIELGRGVNWGQYSLYQMRCLETINFPKGSMTSVPSNAFYILNKIKCVVLPLGMTSLPSNGMYGLYNTEYIIFPSTFTTLPDLAIYENNNLKHLYIPESLTVINQKTFPSNNQKLTNVIVPDTVTYIKGYFLGSAPVEWAYYGAAQNTNGSDSYQAGKASCFSGNHCMHTLIFGENVTKINTGGSSSYGFCANSRNLDTLVFPSKLTSIGNYSFMYGYNLKLIDLRKPQRMVTLGGKNCFTDLHPNCKIVVPDAYYDSYVANTYWSAITATIVKESEYTE